MKYSSGGYIQVLMPEHPRADKNGYVFEHIVVWEKANNQSVPLEYCVHHINGNKKDNRLENLKMMSRSEHTKLHHIGSVRSKSTRKKLSQIAKGRFLDKRNHPSYKDIDVREMSEMRKRGMKVKDICSYYGICKRTFYNKLSEVS